MSRFVLFYAIIIYVATISFGVYLNTAHGEPYNSSKGWPSSAPGGITGRTPAPPKPCRVYLTSCEKSCADRDGLFSFSCLGEEFNPDRSPRYHCQCGDEAFAPQPAAPRPEPKPEQITAKSDTRKAGK